MLQRIAKILFAFFSMSDEVMDPTPSQEPIEEEAKENQKDADGNTEDNKETAKPSESTDKVIPSQQKEEPKQNTEKKITLPSAQAKVPFKKSTPALSKEDIKAKLAGKTLKGTVKPKNQTSAAENMAARIQMQRKHGTSLPPTVTRSPLADNHLEFEKPSETTDATAHRARPKGRRPPTRPPK